MLTDVVERVSENVVRVDVKIDGNWGNGTGILVDNNGTVLTCDHVVRPNNIIPEEISVTKTGEMPNRAIVIKSDYIHDLATIKVPELKANGKLKESGYDTIKVGQECFTLGYPLGLSHLTFAKSFISAKGMGLVNSFQFDTIQIDARVNHGNSGGPLFTNEGDIIGIVTMKYIPFFEKINELHEFVNSIPAITGMDMVMGGFSIAGFINYVNEGIKRMSNALDIVQVGIGWVIPIHFMSNVTP